MRILGIVALSLTPLLFGLDYKFSLKKRRDFLKLFNEFIIFTKEQIRFNGRERDEILHLATSIPKFNSSLFKRIEKCVVYGEDLTKSIKSYNDIRLNLEEIMLVTDFISGLGKSDVDGEISHCDYYINLFNDAVKKSITSNNINGKLSIGLSASLSAVMFILMI